MEKFDSHYIDPRLAQIYDIDSPWSAERDFYLSLVQNKTDRVLDLGCGTGLICRAFASLGHRVTGVDPALSMLEVGKRKPNGEFVEWVNCTAQEFQTTDQFDLIIMTGNALQAILDRNELSKCFQTMKKLLSPTGLIAFETRNPTIHWQDHWNYRIQLVHENETIIESREFIKFQDLVMTFELRYEFPDTVLKSTSRIRFWKKEEILEELSFTGLRLEKLFADFLENKPISNTSKEMIFLVRH